MTEYLLSVHTSPDHRPEPMSEQQMQEQMQRVEALEAEMKERDALISSARLTGTDSATVVDATGGEVITTDGPFAEAKEHLAGFYIVRAADLDDALSWAQRTSECVGMPIEVRAFAGMRGA